MIKTDLWGLVATMPSRTGRNPLNLAISLSILVDARSLFGGRSEWQDDLVTLLICCFTHDNLFLCAWFLLQLQDPQGSQHGRVHHWDAYTWHWHTDIIIPYTIKSVGIYWIHPVPQTIRLWSFVFPLQLMIQFWLDSYLSIFGTNDAKHEDVFLM